VNHLLSIAERDEKVGDVQIMSLFAIRKIVAINSIAMQRTDHLPDIEHFEIIALPK
jgi:hypothetical protein